MNYAGTQKFKYVKHHHTIVTSVWQASVTVNRDLCQQLKLNDLYYCNSIGDTIQIAAA